MGRWASGLCPMGMVTVVTVTVWDGSLSGGLVGSVGEFVLCKSYAVTGTDRNSSYCYGNRCSDDMFSWP